MYLPQKYHAVNSPLQHILKSEQCEHLVLFLFESVDNDEARWPWAKAILEVKKLAKKL